MNYCNQCGQKLEPVWRACPQCGHSTIPPVQMVYKPEIIQDEDSWFNNYGFGTIAMILLIPLGTLFLISSFLMALIAVFLLPHALIFSIIAVIMDKNRVLGIISLIVSGFFLGLFLYILLY